MQYANAKEKDWCKKGHEDDRVARYIMQQTLERVKGVQAVVDVDSEEQYRNADVDLIMYRDYVNPADFVRLIEIKADDFPNVYNPVSKTKEKFVFVETLSNSVKGTQGWIYTTEADYIIYFFMRYNRFILIQTKHLRRIANAGGYKTKRANTFASDNQTILYHSEGVLIPVTDLLPFCCSRAYITPVLTVQEVRKILKIA